MGADEDGNQVIRVMIMRMSKMIMRVTKMIMRRSKMIRVVVVMVINMRMRSVIRWPNHRLGKI